MENAEEDDLEYKRKTILTKRMEGNTMSRMVLLIQRICVLSENR